VAKNVLGRGLGDLLPERRPGVFSGAPVRAASKDPGTLSPGIRALVIQDGGAGGQRASNGIGPQGGISGWVHIALFSSDAVIAGLTVAWAGRGEGSMTLPEATACVLILAFAGWLSCLSAWLYLRQS
jgi:hypothetical protein